MEGELREDPCHCRFLSLSPSGSKSDKTATVGLQPLTLQITKREILVLSDTRGLDFGPYMDTVLQTVRKNWYALIPAEAKEPEKKAGSAIKSRYRA